MQRLPLSLSLYRTFSIFLPELGSRRLLFLHSPQHPSSPCIYFKTTTLPAGMYDAPYGCGKCIKSMF